jgi:hypothetical protein
MPPAAWLGILLALWLSGCGGIQPGTPGHEPPAAGRFNPFTGENSSGR